MKIRSVRAHLLSFPLPEPVVLPYYGGVRTIIKRDAAFTVVETEQGITGYGPAPADETSCRAINERIAPFLAGRTLKDTDALRVMFQQEVKPSTALLRTYDSVELTLFDILAKAFNVPACDLTGGRVRSSIGLYSSGGMYQPPEGYAAEAAAYFAQGFNAYKFRPGMGPDDDLAAVRAIREATSPDFEIMVDAHTWWRMGDKSYGEATIFQLAREMGDLHITWLEEPLPPLDHAAYTRLKDAVETPIASGEHEPDEAGFDDLLSLRCVDYVQADVVCQGGYHTLRTVLASVARSGLSFAFHSWGTALEVVAAAHLGVCWPEAVVPWLEYPCYRSITQPGMYPFPLAEEILTEPLSVRGGVLELDFSRPGFGVDVNLNVIDRFPWIPGPWSFFRLHSPDETFAVTGDHSVRWVDAK
jgi:L-alanine-DL-glutamate epimerase-like enolase superfamily enzyme